MFHQKTLLLAVAFAFCRAYVADKNYLLVSKAVSRFDRSLKTADLAIHEPYETYSQQNYKCISEGRFEDPNDCGQYYDCISTNTGELLAHKKSCFGHGFNTTIKACVQTEMVNGCSTSPTKSERNSITIADLKLHKFCKDLKNDFMCSDCKELVMCVNSVSYTVPCQPGHFCLMNKTEFSGGVCYPGTPSECTCNEDNIFRKDIYNPSKFLSCDTNGSDPKIHTCPGNSVFNEEHRSCGDQSESACLITGSFAIMSDCTRYYTCILTTVGWLKKDFTCSDSSTLYNDKTGVCEDPCDWYTGNFTCKKEGRFANPGDCKTFYECIEDPLHPGKFYQAEHMCPEGYEWGPMANRSYCVASSTTNEECVPSKPNDCKIPNGWCSATTEPPTSGPPTTQEPTTQEPTTLSPADINECAIKNGGCDHTCENTIGSYKCKCDSGSLLDDDKKSCKDINECAIKNGGCDQTCENTIGSYKCKCGSGSLLDDDKKSCKDINECVRADKGGCDQKCENTVGSYKCKCDSGWLLDADKKSCMGTCRTMTCRKLNEECEDNDGKVKGTCKCKAGYDRDNANNCVG